MGGGQDRPLSSNNEFGQDGIRDQECQTYIRECAENVSKQVCDIYDKAYEKREFSTGANRNPLVEKDGSRKLDVAKFFSPLVLLERAKFMDKNRELEDGTVRDGDNWKKGFPLEDTYDSFKRHELDLWLLMDGNDSHAREDIETAICACMFNLESMLLTILEGKGA